MTMALFAALAIAQSPVEPWPVPESCLSTGYAEPLSPLLKQLSASALRLTSIHGRELVRQSQGKSSQKDETAVLESLADFIRQLQDALFHLTVITGLAADSANGSKSRALALTYLRGALQQLETLTGDSFGGAKKNIDLQLRFASVLLSPAMQRELVAEARSTADAAGTIRKALSTSGCLPPPLLPSRP